MDEDAALDAFNAYVRETLARSIDRNFRQHSMILRNALVTCAIAIGPWESIRWATATEFSGEQQLQWLGGFLYGDVGIFLFNADLVADRLFRRISDGALPTTCHRLESAGNVCLLCCLDTYTMALDPCFF